MNFKEFLCEYFDECETFSDRNNPIGEEVKNETVTQDL